jgi:hypothetical protein
MDKRDCGEKEGERERERERVAAVLAVLFS